MKQIASNYSYSPTANVVTLTGVNIDQDQLLLIVAPQVGRTLYNFASGVTGAVLAGVDTRVTLNASTSGLTTTSPLVIFYEDQATAQAVTGTVALDPASLIALENVTVTVGAAVSVSNFPSTQTIAGTVTANVLGYDPYNGVYPSLPIGLALDGIAPADNVVKVAIATELGGVSDSTPLPISGTVTANINDPTNVLISAQIGDALFGSDTLINALNSNLILQNNVPVSGTVTANNPNGSLTTRFGSVVTANLAFITSAVTNTSRKYLLAQNISAGTVTIGIGFSPTTTQGIQLAAGGGLTFDAFCPTGAVYWLGAVTGAAFTILEG